MSNWMFEMLPEGAFQPRPGGAMRLHGGKGSSAPPPDPRLVEAQIKSMGIQDDMIQRVVANSEAMQPLQKEQMQFGLDASRTAFDQSQSDRQWMLGRRDMLSGLQDRLVQDAQGFDSGARQAQLRGEAMADVNAAFSNARGQGLRQMARMGVNPNSGRALAMNNDASLAQASALASASSKVSQAARAEGYALTDRASNALAGYPSMGMQATGAGASYGAAGLGLANQGLAGMNSGFGMGGQMAGQMGSNAAGMYGAMGSYKNGQDQVNQGDSLGGLLGGLGGLAMGISKFGGK